ncbi:hypothetical protein EJB05_49749, partial [Eragrostis curvula]
MPGEEQLVSQDEGVMSLGSEGSEQLLDSLTKKNSDGQDIGESSKAMAADVEAFAEAGSRAPAAPGARPVDHPPKDAAAPSASAPGKANDDYDKYIESVLHGDFLCKRGSSRGEASSSAAGGRAGPSQGRSPLIAMYVERGYFEAGKARPPGDETVPLPKPNGAVVFRDYFEAGLRLPAWGFLERVLERYSVQIHHLTPNAFVQLSKFIWAIRSQNAKLSSDAFIRFYSCHLQNKKVPFDSDCFHSQYGLCTFQPRYFGRWLRVKKVPSAENEDGTECFPLASQIVAAEPIFSPHYESTSTFHLCCKAFRSSCKVISGRTAVEEFIAAGIWPVGRGWKAGGFDERRVGGRKFRYLCPRFDGLKKPEGLHPKQFVEMVEDVANLLCDSFTAVEAQDLEDGLLPKCPVNWIFDSLKITYPDHEVPMGRRRLKKGEEPEISTTSYIQMKGWEKKAEAVAEASPSLLDVRGAVDPDSTGTKPAFGSHAEEESVAGGNADLVDEVPPAFEVSDSEVLLEAPEPKGVAKDAVIDLSDSEEFLDGSNDQVDLMTVDDAGLARTVHQMVNDTQSSSGRTAETSDSEASNESSSSAESSSGAVDYDEISSVATAMMSGLREYDFEELRINLESNSAPDLAELLERQGRVISETSRVLRTKISSGEGAEGVPAELIALRKEKAQWEATNASFENEILRLKSEAKKSADDLATYKTEAEKTHAEAISKAEEDRAALSGAQDLPVGEEVTLDTLFSWLDKEFKILPGLINMMCDHGAWTCLFAMLDLMKIKQPTNYREVGTSSFTPADFAAADAHTKDNEVEIVAKRFWRNYWMKLGAAAARESALIRAKEAGEKKRKGSSSGNPSSTDDEAKAKKAKANVEAGASKATPLKSGIPLSSDPKAAAAPEV